jgi:hypothetical protein
VPAHAAKSVQWFTVENKMAAIPHHPYSLDHAPCDFFLFPKTTLKLKVKKKKINDISKIQQNSQQVHTGYYKLT